MTLEEKVYQMFIVTPEQLTGCDPTTTADNIMKVSIERTPVGGLCFFKKNLVTPGGVIEMLKTTQEYSKSITGLPMFFCIDEEGGTVARIANQKAFGVTNVGNMADIKSESEASIAGNTVGAYLAFLGFNVDFAPDADVLSNPLNLVIGSRSFGSDPNLVAKYASAFSKGLQAQGVLSTFKHFPGHGDTVEDSHFGTAKSNKTYEELLACDLVPFAEAETGGVDFVMVAHISLPNVLGDETPCSLSYHMITEVLRGELGYNGLIITDSLKMGAITNHYQPQTAAVMAVQAGADILLMPDNFVVAHSGVVNAVKNGTISEERINESVRRILEAKQRI